MSVSGGKGNGSVATSNGARASEYTFTDLNGCYINGLSKVFTWTAAAPCCATVRFFGGTVQAFYWGSATAAIEEGTVTMVDSAGFTLYVFPSSSFGADTSSSLHCLTQGQYFTFRLRSVSVPVCHLFVRRRGDADPENNYGLSAR
jgi:hypothetical protein